MTRSPIHPRIEARRALNLANRKSLLRAQTNSCVVGLEDAIAALRALDDSEEFVAGGLLIQIYEWALVELKAFDGGSSTEFRRLAAMGQLLELCLAGTDPPPSTATKTG